MTSKSAANWQYYCSDLQDTENLDWSDLKKTLQIGVNSYGPAYGSTIQVNHDVTKVGSYGSRQTVQEIALHSPTHSYIGSAYFNQMSRWYQEDDNTQIFRMFPGDDNVRNSRANAPRSEVFSLASWEQGDGWYEWSGRYTFLRVRPGAVLQIKHNVTYWSMQLVLQENENDDSTFDLYYVKLRDKSAKTLLLEDVVGKGVDIRVLDDGANHKVYVDGQLMVENSMTDRPKGEQNRFRWGMYSPKSAMDRNILILVTGASVGRPSQQGGAEEDCSSSSSMVSWIVPDVVLSWFASFFEFETLFGNNHLRDSNELQQEFGSAPDSTVLSQWYGDADNDGYGYFRRRQ